MKLNLYFIEIIYWIEYYKIYNNWKRSIEWYCKCCDYDIIKKYKHKKVKWYELVFIHKERTISLIVLLHILFLIYITFIF